MVSFRFQICSQNSNVDSITLAHRYSRRTVVVEKLCKYLYPGLPGLSLDESEYLM